jgi:hypothetical protein
MTVATGIFCDNIAAKIVNHHMFFFFRRPRYNNTVVLNRCVAGSCQVRYVALKIRMIM